MPTVRPLRRTRYTLGRRTRYATLYHWDVLPYAGTALRDWQSDLENRVLSLDFEEDGFLIGFEGLVVTPSTVQRYLDAGLPDPGGGMMDPEYVDLLYWLRSTFSGIRSSLFRISVTVAVEYFDGQETYREECTTRTIVHEPLWYKASEGVRKEYFQRKNRYTRGSRYTDYQDHTGVRYFPRRGDPRGDYGATRKRERRRRPSIPQHQEAPDLFWTIIYAIWSAMDRCIERLQRQGRSYLARVSFMHYLIQNITVKQEDAIA